MLVKFHGSAPSGCGPTLPVFPHVVRPLYCLVHAQNLDSFINQILCIIRSAVTQKQCVNCDSPCLCFLKKAADALL